MIDVREHLRKRIDEAQAWHADDFPGTAFSPFAEMLRGKLCKISPDRYIDNGEFLDNGTPRKQRFGVRFLVQPEDQPDVVFYVDVLLAPDWAGVNGPMVKVKSVDPKDRNQVDSKHDISCPHVKAGDCNESEPVDTFFKRWLVRAFSEKHDEAEKILDYPCERTRSDSQARELSCDLEEIQSRDLDATSRVTLVQARLGQGTFRKDVLGIWGQQCCVTGVTTLAAVRASHIKPWRESSDEERLDAMNGLPLVATLDALFDAGLISFTDEGVLLVQDRLGEEECLRLGLHTLRLSHEELPSVASPGKRL